MLNTKAFGYELKKSGFDFYSGVPCSFLKNLINYAINDCEYIIASNEGEAVAICAGAYLGGRKTVVLMQNSGLTNAISTLTSLNYIFRIPVMGFVSLRGEPGTNDEPQHELMGRITTSLLDIMEIKWSYLSDNIDDAKSQIEIAKKYIENNMTFFFIVKKGIFEKEDLINKDIKKVCNKTKIIKSKADNYIKRIEAIKKINSLKDNNTVLLATTGYTGRELYEIEDSENNFYMVGSMGCISSIGLGLSLVKKNINIMVLDGDGAFIMRMGAIATIAQYNPFNLLHILLDNSAYISTGGQTTVSCNIDFVNLTASVGYNNAFYAHNLDELEKYIAIWKQEKGLSFIYLKVSKDTKENLSRPKMRPYEVKERLMSFLRENDY